MGLLEKRIKSIIYIMFSSGWVSHVRLTQIAEVLDLKQQFPERVTLSHHDTGFVFGVVRKSIKLGVSFKTGYVFG